MDVKYRIGSVSGGFMIATALLLDGIQFLLGLTVLLSLAAPAITVLAGLVFWLWFLLSGVSYSQNAAKKLGTTLAALAVEVIPMIDALPGITVGVVAMIWQSRIEDKQEAKKHAAQNHAQATRAQRIQAIQAARQKAANDNEAEEERLAA